MNSVDKKIIFITGASRSGTTLLSFVLRNHWQVFGLKELHFFGKTWNPCAGAKLFSRGAAVEAVASMLACQEHGILLGHISDRHRREATLLVEELGAEGGDPARLFFATVLHIAEREGKSIPCEQTPRNIFYAAALLNIFSDAHVVHMVRDPRAVMASQKKRWQLRKLSTDRRAVPRYETMRSWVNYHPYTMARLWRRATTEAVRLEGHRRVQLVRYEDLVLAPEKTVRNICEHIGIEFDKTMLDVKQVNSSHQSTLGGSRKGLHTDAIGMWQSMLTPAEVSIVERHCSVLMQRFGYDTKTSRSSGISLGEIGYGLSYLPHLAGVLMINPRRAWIQAHAVRERGRWSGMERNGADGKKRIC